MLFRTLTSIEDFALSQLDRSRFIRVMNHIGDGKKIKEFRERLGAAMNRFEVCYVAFFCQRHSFVTNMTPEALCTSSIV